MSSLGDFLNTMYKKRELEYTALKDQADYDVAGAKAMGAGISSIGSAVGGIGQGIGTAMGKIQGNSIANQLGGDQFGAGWKGGGTAEMDIRKTMGQFDNSNKLSPYQSLMAQQGQTRTDVLVAAENRRRQEDFNKDATAANANASTKYTNGKYDYDAYQADTTANMNQLYGADTPEKFDQFAKRQKSINFGAMQAGIPEDHLQEIPDKFIPQSLQPAQRLFQAQEAFRMGKSQPGDIGKASATYEESAPTDTRKFGRGPGEMAPVTYSTGVPAGSFAPKPGYKAPYGFEAQTKDGTKVKWNGQFFVPASSFK